jgi:hypothetical protein
MAEYDKGICKSCIFNFQPFLCKSCDEYKEALAANKQGDNK